jgi:PAS domain S-box-containing protein
VTIEKPDWLEQMEEILETLNEGVLIVTGDELILFVNSVFLEMTGMTRDEVAGIQLGKFYYRPEDCAILHRVRDKTRRMGRSRDEFYLPTKGGERVPVVVSSRVIADRSGKHFALVTFTDISEQKAVEGRLREANVQLEKRQEEIEEDLLLAARVQKSLTPDSLVWGGVRVDTFYHPARTIGGDFGLVSPLDEQHLNLMVCDVSGHGIGSALIANRIYSETTTQLRSGAPLGDMLRHLNRFVMQDLGGPVYLFTLAVARIDRDGHRMLFAGAGHPPGMVVHPGGAPRLLESRSMVLGAMSDAVGWDDTLEIALQPRDRVVLYTDGITEVFNARREMLGVEGMRGIVGETAELPFPEMKNGILDRVAAWRDGAPTDDVSLVLLEVL